MQSLQAQIVRLDVHCRRGAWIESPHEGRVAAAFPRQAPVASHRQPAPDPGLRRFKGGIQAADSASNRSAHIFLTF